MGRGRRIHHISHGKWIVVILMLCALLTPAFLIFPNLLRMISPKAYTAHAVSRAEISLSRGLARMGAAWGTSAWESLLRETSYATVDLADEELRWQGEIWRDATASSLLSRHTFFWEEKTFTLKSALIGRELILLAPQLYDKPVYFDADNLGLAWDASFCAEMITVPENLKLSAPRATLQTEGFTETLSGYWRELTGYEVLSAAPDPEISDLYRVVFALPDAGRELWHSLMDDSRDWIDFLWFLPDWEKTWNILRDSSDASNCRATFWMDKAHHLRFFALSLEKEQAETLTLKVSLTGRPTNDISLEVRRTRPGELDTVIGLSIAGSIESSERVRTEIALWYNPGSTLHELAINLELGFKDGDLLADIRWDGAEGRLTGGYAADTETDRVSLYIDSLVFGDTLDTFSFSGHFQLDWRGALSAPTDPLPLEDVQPVAELTRFEQDALLASFYQLFYGEPDF